MNEARAQTLSNTRAERARSRAWTRRIRDARRRVPRLVWIVLALVVGLHLVYVLAANVILRTGLLRSWLGSDTSKLYVDYDSAWSPYPGRVIVRGFTLRFQDDNVQMFLELDRASMAIDLVGLTRKAFHVQSLDGQGATFRLRHKLAEAQGQEGRLAAYPPIPGFPDPPVRKPRPKEEIPDESYRLWTIHLEEIATSIRELWIMEYRYRGEGSLSGGMRLRPARELWVAPSTLVTRGGVLSIGDQEILAGSEARVEAEVDAYDVRIPRGTAVFRQLTAKADMRGQLTSLAPFRSAYLRDVPVQLDGGRGPLTVVARVDHGVVHPDTRIEWRSADVTVRAGGATVRGDVAFVGHVDPGRGGAAAALVDPEARPSLVADVALGRAKLTSGRDTLLSVTDARTSIATANTDLTASFPFSAAKLDAADVRAPSLPALGALVLPPRVAIRKGAASGSVRASYRGGALDARADVALDGVQVTSEEVDVAASGKVSGVVTSKDVHAGIGFSGSTVALDHAALRVKNSRVDGLTVRVDAVDGLVRTKNAPSVDTTVSLAVAPGDQVLRLGASLASLPKQLGEAPAGPDARANVRVHGGKDAIDVRVLEARDGDLVVRGRVRKPQRTPASGAFLFEVGILRAGLEIAGGETHVRPFASREWLDEKTR